MGGRRWLFLVTTAIALAGCAASRPAADPSLGLAAASRSWVSPAGRRHPLVGVVYDVAAARIGGAADVIEAAASADFVLLGEQHDNVDHHRLQAALLHELLSRGRRPAMAFEQIDLEKQAAVDFVLADDASSSVRERADRVAEVVAWSKSGWPPFDQYRPVFETALAADLPLKAANLSRAKMRELFQADGKPVPEAPGLPKLTDEQKASMKDDIVDSHCGYAPDGLVISMIEGQRRRDAAMARAVADAAALPAPGRGARGAVLLCGFAHARADYGVPLYLAAAAPGRRIVSIAFVEVGPAGKTPADYAEALHAERLPFDFVVFTPRVDNEDSCEKYRPALDRMKKAASAPKG